MTGNKFYQIVAHWKLKKKWITENSQNIKLTMNSSVKLGPVENSLNMCGNLTWMVMAAAPEVPPSMALVMANRAGDWIASSVISIFRPIFNRLAVFFHSRFRGMFLFRHFFAFASSSSFFFRSIRFDCGFMSEWTSRWKRQGIRGDITLGCTETSLSESVLIKIR